MSPSKSILLAPLVGAAALALAACGASSPPPAEAPPAAATPPASAAPSAAASPKGAPSAGAPTARVLGVAVSDKSEHFTRVTTSFENPTDRKCKITSYTLTWAGGSKEIPLDDFSLAPGQSQTRATRIHPNDGDLTKLVGPETAQVSVRATCGSP